MQWMVNGSLTFANGAALAAKHTRPGRAVIETRTTTIETRATSRHATTPAADRRFGC